MADLQDLQSEAAMYKLASGDTSPIDSIGQENYAPHTSGADTLPEDFMPVMPMRRPMGFQPNYFVSGPQAQQVGEAPPIDHNTQNLLTNILRAKESSGNYQAVNPHSSASGAYQYTDSTWNGFGGYSKAALAPAEVQDAKFSQDIAQRLAAYSNDPYKAIVAHYLPALANQPQKWAHPFKVNGRAVQPALSYLRYVVKGTPLEAGLDDYLAHGGQPNIGMGAG